MSPNERGTLFPPFEMEWQWASHNVTPELYICFVFFFQRASPANRLIGNTSTQSASLSAHMRRRYYQKRPQFRGSAVGIDYRLNELDGSRLSNDLSIAHVRSVNETPYCRLLSVTGGR
jgi:hypothetical protein